MNREEFKREKKKIFFYTVVYGFICEVFSLFILGFDLGFGIGLILGICAIIINFALLEIVIDFAINTKKIWLAFPLQLGRFLLFGLLAYVSYQISLMSIIAYGIGILSIVPSAVVTYVRPKS